MNRTSEGGSDPAKTIDTQIGIVICCHGSMGSGVREAAEMIVGRAERLAVVGVFPGDGRDVVTAAIREAVREVDGGRGVIVLADMPGGTPFNLAAAEPLPARTELVSGFNLPSLLKALSGRRHEDDVGRLAGEVVECGRRHMVRGVDPPEPCPETHGGRR